MFGFKAVSKPFCSGPITFDCAKCTNKNEGTKCNNVDRHGRKNLKKIVKSEVMTKNYKYDNICDHSIAFVVFSRIF